MTYLLSRVTRICTGIVAMAHIAARGPRAGLAHSKKPQKSPKIENKSSSEEKPGSSVRRASILGPLTAVKTNSFYPVPRNTKLLHSEFDVASFCSDLDAIRVALVPFLAETETNEGNDRWHHGQEPVTPAVSTSSQPSAYDGSASLEDDVADAVRLL
jgi:hypothetical protein